MKTLAEKLAKKKASKLAKRTISTVQEMANLLTKQKLFKVYYTTNPDLLINSKYNRGVKNGLEKTRKDNILTDIDNGDYAFKTTFVLINLDATIINGTHTKKALSERNLPIPFMITDDPKFNGVSDREFANNQSIINNTNSCWRAKGNVQSALEAGERCIVNIDVLTNLTVKKREFVGQKGILKSSVVTPAKVIQIVNNFEGNRTNGKELRGTYCREDYADIMETEEFKDKFTNIVRILERIYLGNTKVRGFAVVRELGIYFRDRDLIPNWNKALYVIDIVINKFKDFDTFGDKKMYVDIIVKDVLEIMLKK